MFIISGVIVWHWRTYWCALYQGRTSSPIPSFTLLSIVLCIGLLVSWVFLHWVWLFWAPASITFPHSVLVINPRALWMLGSTLLLSYNLSPCSTFLNIIFFWLFFWINSMFIWQIPTFLGKMYTIITTKRWKQKSFMYF